MSGTCISVRAVLIMIGCINRLQMTKLLSVLGVLFKVTSVEEIVLVGISVGSCNNIFESKVNI